MIRIGGADAEQHQPRRRYKNEDRSQDDQQAIVAPRIEVRPGARRSERGPVLSPAVIRSIRAVNRLIRPHG